MSYQAVLVLPDIIHLQTMNGLMSDSNTNLFFLGLRFKAALIDILILTMKNTMHLSALLVLDLWHIYCMVQCRRSHLLHFQQ